MGRHDHAAWDTVRSHRYLRAVREAAHDLTFRAPLGLMGGQVQTRLNERMVEHAVLFATSDEGEASQLGERGPGAVLSIEPEQGASLWELMRHQVTTDGHQTLAQFHLVAPVASIAKRAEPTFNYEPD